MTTINGLPHPTPVHIHSAILYELELENAERVARGEKPIAVAVCGVIRRGLARACAEHDEGKL